MADPTPPVLGWREWVHLEDLCDAPIRAKVDTGARTSSLHAYELELVEVGDSVLAEFSVEPEHGSGNHHRVQADVVEFRTVQSSTGHQQTRPVIRTRLRLGSRSITTDVTLTARDEMGFGMLLGRSAIADRFLVDPARSYCTGEPT